MRQPDLIRSIQNLEAENQQLRAQMSQLPGVNFEQKYMKALREISTIMNANKQFKSELMKLREERQLGGDNELRIQKQELAKAYEKLLIEKNQLYGEKEHLELENQKLNYTVASLEENIANLKSEKRTLAQEKQSLRMLSPKSEKQRGGPSRQLDMKKNMETYEEHHASLNKTIQKLEEDKRSLENKLYELQSQFTNRLNEKQIQARQAKSRLKDDYESKMNELRRQISKLKVTNNQLSIKVQSHVHEERENDGHNDYEKQLIQTLREVRAQMQPMRMHIAQLQEKNEFQKEQTEREKANLEIKVIEFESEIVRLKELQKIYESKQIRESENNRRIEDAERTIRKLEQENRMLGGRLIVLESKQVALRNRNGDQLQERVLEFQNRVEMLLSDKETIANMKNVGIHQLIALKAYILELDAKLKQVVNENEYAVKKYKTYKEKCSQLIKQLKQHDIAINALKGKLQGYDRLVVKLQGEFERAISINDAEIKALNIKISEQSAISIEVYKKRYDSLLEKLTLQQKYSEQEIETLKLNYETKIVELNIKLEELSSIKETIGLYKTKNEELSVKLSEKQNQLLEAKINRSPNFELPQPRNPNKQTIQRLNQTINSKETTILNLQNQIRKIESEWKSKYSQLEQQTNTNINKRNILQQEKQNQIDNLQQQIKGYRTKINELQAKIYKLENNEPSNKNEIEYKQYQQIANKKSELEIDLEQIKNKYESESTKNMKLNKSVNDLKKSNQEMESELSKLRYEMKNVEKELQLELEEKNNEIRRLRIRSEEASSITPRVDISETMKVSSLKIEIQSLNNQIELLEKDKQRYYNKTIEMQRKNVELDEQLQRIKYQLTRLKNTNNEELNTLKDEQSLNIQNLEHTIRILKDKIRNYEEKETEYSDQLARLKTEQSRQKNRLLQDLQLKEEEYNKIFREFNRLRSELSGYQDSSVNIQNQYEFKMARFTTQINGYKQEIENNMQQLQRYQRELRKYRERQSDLISRVQQLQNNTEIIDQHRLQIQKYDYELRITKEREQQLKIQQNDLQAKISNIERLYRLQSSQLQEQISTLSAKLTKYEQDMKFYENREVEIEQGFNDRETYANRLAERINELENRESELEQELYNKNSEFFRINSEINAAKGEIQILQNTVQSKDSQIARLTQEIKNIRNQISDWEEDIYNKDSMITRLKSELSSANNQINSLEEMLEEAQKETNKWKYQHNFHEENSANIKSELDEKQSTITRLQTDLRSKSQYINELSDEVETKNMRINQLQNETMRLRTSSADHESQIMDRNAQISRLTFQLNSLKTRYTELQEESQTRESQWQGMNRQLLTIKSNLQEYEQEINIKESMVERYKKDIKDLNDEIQRLNTELFDKNKQVNILNQQIFRLKLEGDEKSSSNIYKLQSEVSMLKSKINNLENQLQNKQYELNRAEMQIQTYKLNVNTNKYSDDEYDTLQSQFYQLQNTLNATNRKISEFEFTIEELNSKIEYQKKVQKDLRKQFQNDKEILQQEIETIMKRERKLKVDFESLQHDYEFSVGGTREEMEKKDFGMHLYQNEVDRLNGIVEELTEEIDGLKLKLTNMTNQQDRIVENLTVMTLTFAQVQALRDRMKAKENEISEVRKSLIQYASSSNEQLSLNSKKLLQLKDEEFRSHRNFLTEENLSSAVSTNKLTGAQYSTQNYQTYESNADKQYEIQYQNSQYQNNRNAQYKNQYEEQQDGIFAARNVQSYGTQGFYTGNRDFRPQNVINEVANEQTGRDSTNREFQSGQMKDSGVAHSYSESSNKFQNLVQQEMDDHRYGREEESSEEQKQMLEIQDARQGSRSGHYYQQGQSSRSGSVQHGDQNIVQQQRIQPHQQQNLGFQQQVGQVNIRFGGGPQNMSEGPINSYPQPQQQLRQQTISGSFNVQPIKAPSPGIPQSSMYQTQPMTMQRTIQHGPIYPQQQQQSRPAVNFGSNVQPQGYYLR